MGYVTVVIKMRIGIAYTEHGRDRGVERISAEGALAAARAGNKVEYYCYAHGQPDHPNITFHTFWPGVPINSLRIARFARLAGLAIRHSNADVTHSFGGVIGCDVISAQSCHLAGMEAVKAGRDEIREEVNLGIADRVRLYLERQNYAGKQYRIVIACSQRVKRELHKWYNVPEDDVVVIPNGVDLAAFNPDVCRVQRKGARERFGVLENEFLLLFAGNEFARKGLETVIMAMKELANPSIRLLVAGGGRIEPYRRFADRLGVLGQVTFAGHVNDMVPCYGAADLFVFPTRYEAFGLVITEAMACGVPVLVSASAGSAEDFICDGRDGILISDPRDPQEVAAKIRLIREDWELRTRLSSLARLRVIELGWETYGRRLLEVYDRAAAIKKGRAGSR